MQKLNSSFYAMTAMVLSLTLQFCLDFQHALVVMAQYCYLWYVGKTAPFEEGAGTGLGSWT